MTRYLVLAGNRAFIRDWTLPPGACAEPVTLEIGGREVACKALRFAPPVKAAPDPRTAAERRLMAALEEMFHTTAPAVAGKLAAGVWPTDEELTQAFGTVLQVELAATATDALQELAADVGVQFDPTVANTAMAAWARQYTFELVKGLNTTTQASLREIMARFAETPGMQRQELEDAILEAMTQGGGPFSAARAEAIAVTEVTRANSQAHNDYQKQLAAEGLEFERVWHTSRDEITCPVCLPLDGQPESVWKDRYPDGPAAHPRCRCAIGLRLKRTAGHE